MYEAHYAHATRGLVSTFYDQYYLPAAQNITGLRIGRAAMPIPRAAVSASAASKGVLLELMPMAAGKGAQIYFTMDGSAVTPRLDRRYESGQILSVPAGVTLRAVSYADGLEPSRELVVEGETPRVTI